MAGNGLILSFNEVRILLYGLGVRQIEGIRLPETAMERDAALYAMHHLSRRGILTVEGEIFYVREDVKEMLLIMASPSAAFPWKPQEEDGPWYYCYVSGDCVVVSEQCEQKQHAVRLQKWKLSDFIEWKEQTEHDDRGDDSAGDGEALRFPDRGDDAVV